MSYVKTQIWILLGTYIDSSRAVYRISPSCSFPQISKWDSLTKLCRFICKTFSIVTKHSFIYKTFLESRRNIDHVWWLKDDFPLYEVHIKKHKKQQKRPGFTVIETGLHQSCYFFANLFPFFGCHISSENVRTQHTLSYLSGPPFNMSICLSIRLFIHFPSLCLSACLFFGVLIQVLPWYILQFFEY